MILTHRLQEAISEASRLHRDQIRKDELRTPYISHLIGVMVLLSMATHDEDVLIAGLLHDALEDTDYTKEEIETKFGARVKEIVLGVTEESKMNHVPRESWKHEKEHYIENLRQAGDESVMVSLADKTHNLGSLIEIIRDNKGGVLAKFGSDHADRIWFNEEVLKIGEERLGDDHVLVEEMRLKLDEMKKVLEGFK
jgi:(p)ppGpp synthase/HD superfamily hydrolase